MIQSLRFSRPDRPAVRPLCVRHSAPFLCFSSEQTDGRSPQPARRLIPSFLRTDGRPLSPIRAAADPIVSPDRRTAVQDRCRTLASVRSAFPRAAVCLFSALCRAYAPRLLSSCPNPHSALSVLSLLFCFFPFYGAAPPSLHLLHAPSRFSIFILSFFYLYSISF